MGSFLLFVLFYLNTFSQLFGEDDPDQDVSPDTEDPEARVEGEHSVTETGDVKRTSTHQWAQEINYDPSQLFNKFFKTDIEYLLKMGKFLGKYEKLMCNFIIQHFCFFFLF